MQLHSLQQSLRIPKRLGITPIELAIALSILAVLVPLAGPDDDVPVAVAGRTQLPRGDASGTLLCAVTYTDPSVSSTAAVFSTVVTSGC